MLKQLADAVADSGQMLIQDTSDPAADPPPGFTAADGVASLHAVQIADLGMLLTVHARPSPRGFTNLCQRVARSVADGAVLVIRRALAQEELSHENASLERRASTDPLTAVANRGGWDDAIVDAQRELERGRAVYGVAVFDVDGLKSVNDGYGHAAGDSLLRAFGSILGQTARAQDLVARIGGDEFAVLLRDCDAEGSRAWCERVIEAVDEHNRVHPDEPRIEVSFGSAATGERGNLGDAVAEADRELYGDKAA
jgi:diguanylate cyclase (GGDEF)-like protein